MKSKVKLLKGNKHDVISANVTSLKNSGMGHNQAMHLAMKHANKGKGKMANNKFDEKLNNISDKVSRKTEKMDNLGG